MNRLNIHTGPAGGLGMLLMVLFATPSPAQEADALVVDTSDWKCEDCPFEQGYSGTLELGVGNVSDSSFKFGEYNGLNEDSGFVIANAQARYRDLDADYLDLSVRDLGLGSRSLYIEGGRQGSYSLFLGYDEISRFISDSIQTPYRGAGSDTLTLPAGWVTAGNTAGMTQLDASLQTHELEMERKRLDLGASFIADSPWKYDVKYRHETREGTRRSAGTFLVLQAARLIEPVDYETEQVDASASYLGEQWQFTLAYYGSFFSNDHDALTWENAYTPLTTGADSGQLALPPDNQFNQLILSTGYQMSQETRISGDIAVGRMEQDEDFLPATLNASLAPVSLPRNSAEAQVDTLVGDLRVISALSDKLRLNAAYKYSDHDNRTPQSQYDWISTDVIAATTSRTNQPYSFTRRQITLSGDYYASRTTRVAAGLEQENYERSLQEVDETDEITAWGKLTVRAKDFTDLTLRVARAERDASAYRPVSETDPPQNPLLRKYNMADRNRTSTGVTANSMVGETINLGMSLDYADDDYTESVLGLQSARELSVHFDTSVLISNDTSMHMFAGRDDIRSKQAGGQSTAVAEWTATNRDQVDSLGLGFKHRFMDDKLEMGMDYVMSNSTGRITVFAGSPDDLPELTVDMDSIRIYADYRLKDNMSVHAGYWYERYDTRDWALDGVDVDTISNVLSLGETSPDYELNVVSLSLRYTF